MNYLLDYLKNLENNFFKYSYEEMYLWPRTPIGGDHQDIIRRRVGVNDHNILDPRSRTAIIIKQIGSLINRKHLKENFSIVDLCCGDAIVLRGIKSSFPTSNCYGCDCNIGKFSTHGDIEKAGVSLFNIYLQQIIKNDPEEKFDIVLMLNSYRGWESANLRSEYINLPQETDQWFSQNANFVIITATKKQVKELKKNMSVAILGKGEDNSFIVCMSAHYKIGGISIFQKLSGSRLFLTKRFLSR